MKKYIKVEKGIKYYIEDGVPYKIFEDKKGTYVLVPDTPETKEEVEEKTPEPTDEKPADIDEEEPKEEVEEKPKKGARSSKSNK